MKRLLLVEDDRSLSIGLTDAFTLEGLAVTAARDGEKARALLREQSFDVIVLDLMLPGRSGLDVLRELRARGDATPVLILTARGGESDKVLGLELGADDYVTKPFSLRELVARVRALLRRTEAKEPPPAEPSPARFKLGVVEVDLGAFVVRRGDGRSAEESPLSRKEAALLQLLYEARGQAVRREKILELAWDGGGAGTRTIDMHVLHLRQKLEQDPAAPRYLQTVHGIGYRLVLPAPDGSERRGKPKRRA